MENILVPKTIKKKFVVFMDTESFKKKLYELIDLRFSRIDDESFSERFKKQKQKYFGTIGQDFFEAKVKFVVGEWDTYSTAKIKGDFNFNNKTTDLKLSMEPTKKTKQQITWFTIFPLLLLVMTIISPQDPWTLPILIIIPLAILVFHIIHRALHKNASKTFVTALFNIFDSKVIEEITDLDNKSQNVILNNQ